VCRGYAVDKSSTRGQFKCVVRFSPALYVCNKMSWVSGTAHGVNERLMTCGLQCSTDSVSERLHEKPRPGLDNTLGPKEGEQPPHNTCRAR
jgi:hypothetical protein